MTFPDWSGSPAYVVAAGQSAAECVPNIPRGDCRVMTVNLSCELVPWADALYAADVGFWTFYESARRFPGLKFSVGGDTARRVVPSIIPVTTARNDNGLSRHEMLRERLGVIGHGENSGFQALNLVVQFGANPIFLVGFDYHGKHWHKDHAAGLRNPPASNMRQWAYYLDAQAERLATWGFRVVNLSPSSLLRSYEHGDGRLPYPHATSLPARSV